MPEYLIILLTIMSSLIICLTIYLFFVFRKIAVASKKIDYLIEDITYKSEVLSPMIDSILKLSSYIDVLDIVFKKKSSEISKVIDNNSENIKKFNKQLQKVLERDNK